MKEKSLKKNAFYYMIFNMLNVIFPFVTGIYVARVLLPDTIGIVTSAQNFAQYFIILSFLGIPTYALREISRLRNDRTELNKLYSELFIINFISTVFFSTMYLSLILCIPEYNKDFNVFFIVGLSIALNAINNTWLYDGLEEFKFTTIRNLVFKVLTFGILLLFVKNDGDIYMYSAINVIAYAGNYILNIIYSRKFVSFTFKGLNLKRHLKSIFFLVVVNLAIEIYSLVDITMLNFFVTKDHITFYSYGLRINSILLQIVNTFTIVIVPRLSLYYKEKRVDDFNSLVNNTLRLLAFLSIPMVIGIQFVSNYFLVLLYGDLYISSAVVLRILSPILIISPIGYLLGSRMLLIHGKEKQMVIPVMIGAIVNVLGNYFLIKEFGEIGAASASLISETVVCLIYVFMGFKYYKIENVKLEFLKIIYSSFIMLSVLYIISISELNEGAKVSLEVPIAIFTYILVLVALKEEIVVGMVKTIKNRLKRRK